MQRALRTYWKPALLIALMAAIGVFCVGVLGVGAQEATGNLTAVGIETGLSATDPRIILARVIRAFLGTIGIILVILVIYAGFIWMTAAGDPAKVAKAQKILTNAGIGLVIIIASLAITQFVIGQLLRATGLGTGSSDSSPEIITPFSASLGSGVIDNHFPRRNATDVPRNTNIVVSFSQPMDPATIMAGFDPAAPELAYNLQEEAVIIRPTDDDIAAALGLTPLTSTEVSVVVTPDFQTFVFDPSPLLGTAAENVDYTVELTSDVSLLDGSAAFTGVYAGGYSWSFDVSTVVDLTPPTIESVIPVASASSPRNVLVQVNYSEPVNPVSAVGAAPGFTNVQVTSASTIISGEWSLGNSYQTSEFVSSTACGTNSCGETIYCLPGNASISGLVRSAALSAEPPTALAPYAGIVDMAGNALDGNGDAEAGDDYAWSFSTTNEIVLDPPSVDDMNPPLVSVGVPAQNIAFDSMVDVTFNTLMSVSTINSNNLTLYSPSGQLWYTFDVDAVDGSGAPVTTPSLTSDRSKVEVNHAVFSENRLYGVEIGSGVRSIFQNCFIPSTSNVCSGPNCCNDNPSATNCVYSP